MSYLDIYDNGGVDPQFTGPRTSGQIGLTQTIFVQNFGADKFIAIAKELKGGLHKVKYRSLLYRDDIYDGIFGSRREKGMLVYVEFEDDDTVCDKYYSLKTFPGTLESHWEEWSPGSGTSVTLNNPQTVATIIARDALTPVANDFVNVTDARTPQEIIDVDPVYSTSFIYDGTNWLIVYPYGQDPDRHAKNNDIQLKRESNNAVVSADSIATHMADNSKHKNLNDANNAGALNEDWSSAKIREELDKKVDVVVNGDGTLFLSDDGTYKAVNTSGGSGLADGDILFGGTAAG